MKKILLINCFDIAGGAEVVFQNTYSLLKKLKDCKVEKFVGSQEYTKVKNPISYIWSISNMNNLKKKIQDFEPDIIHIHGFHHILSPSILYVIKKHKNKGIKVIFTAHDYHLVYPNSALLYFDKNCLPYMLNPKVIFWDILFKKVDHRGFVYSTLKKVQWIIAYKIFKLQSTIDHIICPSVFMENVIKTNIKVNTSMVYNPIDLKKFSHEDKKSETKENQKLKIVYIGRLSQEKGLIQFINQLKNINSIDFVFDIYGNGELQEELNSLINKYSLSEKIVLKGFVDNKKVPEILNNYDVLVLPSLWFENAPLVLIEGALSGLKLLTMNYGGMKELAEICNNYALINKDYNNIENSLLSLKDMNFILNEDFHKYFSEESYLKKLLKVYGDFSYENCNNS